MSSSPSGIFSKALEIDDLEQREQFLIDACSGTSNPLYKEVHSLLESFQKTDSLFEKPLSIIPEVKGAAEESLISFPYEFGNYTLLEEIGHGGMGVIYKATQAKLQRYVALKMIKDGRFATQSIVKRFYSEAQAASNLSHPNIVPVYETGRIEDQYFYSMGYVNGPNLEEYIHQYGPLSIEDAVPFIETIAKAVSYAHQQGIIHRDLKPANILLSEKKHLDHNSFAYAPVISDFGLAKRINHDDGFTLNGEIIGTPGFMAPEQVNKYEDHNSVTADIYSLGALLFFMLTGKPPIKGDNVLDSLQKIVHEEPKSLRSQIPNIPEDLNRICSTCLERDPRQRYQYTTTLVQDLKSHQSGHPILARKISKFEKLIKFCKRHPTGSLAAGLAFCLLLGTILIPIFWALESEKNLREVQEARTKAVREKTETIFNSAIQTNHDRPTECLTQFLETAKLARELGDTKLEQLCRLNIGARKNNYWSFENSIDTQRYVSSAVFSPNETEFAIYDSNTKTIYFHELQSGESIDSFVIKRPPDEIDNPLTFRYHPNGEDFLSLEYGKLYIWKKEAGKIARKPFPFQLESAPDSFKEHMWIPHFDFINEGKTIVISNVTLKKEAKIRDGQLLSWDYHSGQFIETVAKYDSPIKQFELSESSKKLLVSLDNGEIHGINLKTQSPLFTPFDYKRDIGFISFSNDEDFFLIPSKGNFGISLRKIEAGRIPENIYKFGHNSIIHDVINNKSNNLFISASRDNKVKFWNISNHQLSNTPIKLNYNPKGLHLSKTQNHLYIASVNGKILKYKKPIKNLIRHKKTNKRPVDIIFGANDETLIIGNEIENNLDFYNSRTNNQSQHFSQHKINKTGGGYAERRLCRCESRDSYFSNVPGSRFINEQNIHTGETLDTYGPLKGNIYKSVISHNEKFLAALTRNRITVFEINTKKEFSFQIHGTDPHTPIIFSSDNSQILIGKMSGAIHWHDYKTGTLVRSKKFGEGNIKGIDIHLEKKYIAIASDNATAAVFDEESWNPISPKIKHNDRVALASFSINGEFLMTATKGNTARIWDIQTGKPICPPIIHQNRIRDIEFSPSGEKFLTADRYGNISLWKFPEEDSRSFEEIEEWINTKMNPF